MPSITVVDCSEKKRSFALRGLNFVRQFYLSHPLSMFLKSFLVVAVNTGCKYDSLSKRSIV